MNFSIHFKDSNECVNSILRVILRQQINFNSYKTYSNYMNKVTYPRTLNHI